MVPAARRFLRALVLLSHGFRGETITLRASALTYLTLLSLVPLLAVAYSIVDLVSGQAPFRDSVQRYVNEQLGVGAGAAIAGALTKFTNKATVKALGAIGFGVLLVSALSLLWNIESAFNHIYGVKRPRAPVQRLLTYWAFLTLGPVLLSSSLAITWKIGQMQEAHAHGQQGHSEVLHVLAAASSVAITYVGLAFLYKVLPNARVRLRAALAAAFAAGTAWELAKYVFAEVSARMVQVHKIYGSVAVLPIVLMWIYISWFIALTGCRLCYAMDASRAPEPSPMLRSAQARETFIARVMVAVAQLHARRAAPVGVAAVADEMRMPKRLVRESLRALEQSGLAVEARRGGWLPARDPSRITMAEVRAAARISLGFPRHEADEAGEAITQMWARAEGAAARVMEETLADFIARLRQPTGLVGYAAPAELPEEMPPAPATPVSPRRA
ncbi:MAG TPA: YhjD/YihY/BrkB family envelope integrity protein [Myxococcales bacterium]|nr:YhjD/YihY/BrkB family envelope integrity protein [Myxococcales bacterium]